MGDIIKSNEKQGIQLNDVNRQWIKEYETKVAGVTEKKYKILPMELSKYIKQAINYISVRGAANERTMTYVYIDGYYKWVSDDELKGFIKEFIPYQLRQSKDINEVLLDLKTENNFVDYEDLDNDESIINFEDGIYNVKTDEFMPHSPEILSTIQIPAKYEEIKKADTNAPVFLNYLDTLCSGDTEYKILLLQFLGLTISNFRGYRTKKALFLVGDGDSGKSQIKSLAEYLVGYKNITTVDLKTLNERFGASALYQKRLAGCNDMNYEKIKDMSIFKQLTGGDTINVEFKGMSSFNYLYKGVLWFNCNELPQFSGDQGKWVYDRFMIIYCNNVIPKEKQDPYLLDKMKKEKNTIIKLALMSLKQLMDNKFKLEEPSRSKELRDQYEIKNNTLLTFVEKYCEIKEDIKHYERLKKTEFRQAYDNYIKLYCNGKGKVTGERMDKILAKHYGETYRKSSIWYMRKIVLTKAGKEELGLIYVDESRSSDIVWEN